VGLVLSVLPVVALLVLVYTSSVGGAPGMVLGFLVLPALAVSGLGCVTFVAASARHLRALLLVPICLTLYIAVFPVAQWLASHATEVYFANNIELFRTQAAKVSGGKQTLERINAEFKTRKMPVYALTDAEYEPEVVAFVLGGTLGHYAGFAFSNSGKQPSELAGSFVQLWRPYEEGIYYFTTGDNPEYN